VKRSTRPVRASQGSYLNRGGRSSRRPLR
jgi:hypothetical protein